MLGKGWKYEGLDGSSTDFRNWRRDVRLSKSTKRLSKNTKMKSKMKSIWTTLKNMVYRNGDKRAGGTV